MKTELVDVCLIRVGDTIVHRGEIRTVSGNNIKRNRFMGTTLFGDSYRLGYKKVVRIRYENHPLFNMQS